MKNFKININFNYYFIVISWLFVLFLLIYSFCFFKFSRSDFRPGPDLISFDFSPDPYFSVADLNLLDDHNLFILFHLFVFLVYFLIVCIIIYFNRAELLACKETCKNIKFFEIFCLLIGFLPFLPFLIINFYLFDSVPEIEIESLLVESDENNVESDNVKVKKPVNRSLFNERLKDFNLGRRLMQERLAETNKVIKEREEMQTAYYFKLAQANNYDVHSITQDKVAVFSLQSNIENQPFMNPKYWPDVSERYRVEDMPFNQRNSASDLFTIWARFSYYAELDHYCGSNPKKSEILDFYWANRKEDYCHKRYWAFTEQMLDPSYFPCNQPGFQKCDYEEVSKKNMESFYLQYRD
jgi:hypothetical protein